MWNWTEDKIKLDIIWIRHGMTASNEQYRYLGKTEEDLSPKGIALLEKNKEKYPLQDNRFLYASPMKRCIQTAEILFGRKPMLIPEWREMDFGLFEGKNYLDLKDNADYQKWIDSNGTLPFPGGESKCQFMKRSMDGFSFLLLDILKKLDTNVPQKENPEVSPEKEAAVTAVVHGGTIMAVLSTLTGGEYFDFQVGNGEGYHTLLTWQEDKIVVEHCEKCVFDDFIDT